MRAAVGVLIARSSREQMAQEATSNPPQVAPWRARWNLDNTPKERQVEPGQVLGDHWYRTGGVESIPSSMHSQLRFILWEAFLRATHCGKAGCPCRREPDASNGALESKDESVHRTNRGVVELLYQCGCSIPYQGESSGGAESDFCTHLNRMRPSRSSTSTASELMMAASRGEPARNFMSVDRMRATAESVSMPMLGPVWETGAPIYKYEIVCDESRCVFDLMHGLFKMLHAGAHRVHEDPWPSSGIDTGFTKWHRLVEVKVAASCMSIRSATPPVSFRGVADPEIAYRFGIFDFQESGERVLREKRIEAAQRVSEWYHGIRYRSQIESKQAMVEDDELVHTGRRRKTRLTQRSSSRRAAADGNEQNQQAAVEQKSPNSENGQEDASGEGGQPSSMAKKKARKRNKRKQQVRSARLIQRWWRDRRSKVQAAAASILFRFLRRTGKFRSTLREQAAFRIQRVAKRFLRGRREAKASAGGGLAIQPEAPRDERKMSLILRGGMGRTFRVLPPELSLSMVCPPSLHLTHEMFDFVKSVEAFNGKVARARSRILQQVRMCLQRIFPCSQLHLFGSVACGTALPSSDLDCFFIHLDGQMGICNRAHMGDWVGCCMAQFSPIAQLELLQEELYRQQWITDIVLVRSVGMPLLRFLANPYAWSEEDEAGLVSVAVDISCGMSARHSQGADTVLVNSYAETFPSLIPLVLVLKQYLKEQRLSDPFSGGIGSFALILLIVRYLQDEERPRRPQAATSGTTISGSAGGMGSRFQEFDTMIKRTHYSSHCGEHLLGFLHFYGYEFSKSYHGVDVRDGGRFLPIRSDSPQAVASPNKAPTPTNSGSSNGLHTYGKVFTIVNPLNPLHNVAASAFNISGVFAAFRRAAETLDQAMLDYDADSNAARLGTRSLSLSPTSAVAKASGSPQRNKSDSRLCDRRYEAGGFQEEGEAAQGPAHTSGSTSGRSRTARQLRRATPADQTPILLRRILKVKWGVKSKRLLQQKLSAA
eukprot:scaffold820_cov227-Pinguiococcus_pyrenoidosus.AAC.7